jgi:hypothetical protein
MNVPAWHLLPVEVLEHIITFVPRLLRPSLGDVCVQWAWALHSSALKYLTTSINLQRIEESHLSRLGWSRDIKHDVSSCMCVDLAFRSGLAKNPPQKKPPKKTQKHPPKNPIKKFFLFVFFCFFFNFILFMKIIQTFSSKLIFMNK